MQEGSERSSIAIYIIDWFFFLFILTLFMWTCERFQKELIFLAGVAGGYVCGIYAIAAIRAFSL